MTDVEELADIMDVFVALRSIVKPDIILAIFQAARIKVPISDCVQGSLISGVG